MCAVALAAVTPLWAATTEQKLEKLRRFSEKLDKIQQVLGAIDNFGKNAGCPVAEEIGPTQTFEPGPDAEFSFEPHGMTGRGLYPSFIISTATVEAKPSADDLTTYGDVSGPGYVGVLLRNVRKDDKFVVEVSCDGVLKPSKCSFTVKTSEVAVLANPKLKFDYEVLARVSQTRPVGVTFKVTRNGVEQEEVTQTWQLHQINDCIFALNLPRTRRDGVTERKFRDARFMFAAYVNENHPFVDEILKEAKSTGIVDRFVGYQSDEAEVGRQIKAVWQALQNRRVTYSSITDTTGASDIYMQHVRFLDQSINSTQANCVDGSVLMASVLKKIGLRCHLILVPGHCYLGVYVKEPTQLNNGQLIGIETTLLGSQSTIEDAVNMATFNAPYCLKRNASKFSIKNSGYLAVDLGAARKIGIMPLPYNK